MAARAFGLDVFSAQRVFRVAVMFKGGDGPILFNVAGLALLAEASLVSFLVIIILVAGGTGGFELLLI